MEKSAWKGERDWGGAWTGNIIEERAWKGERDWGGAWTGNMIEERVMGFRSDETRIKSK